MDEVAKRAKKQKILLFFSISFFVIVTGVSFLVYFSRPKVVPDYQPAAYNRFDSNFSAVKLAPGEEVVLPIRWGSLGKKLVEAGVIDPAALESIYQARGGLNQMEKLLLSGEQNGWLAINARNAGFLLNLFWAFGLSNDNRILKEGPMTNPRYGGIGGFASVGGWTIAKGGATRHYARHPFVVLSSEQQSLVERVSKNIYRPCCDNPAHFPDCNHGMAMLGALELMAAQGATEEEMYQAALALNSFWFPDTYRRLAQHLASQNLDWARTSPKVILSYNFSSASGFRNILNQMEPTKNLNQNSCGV